MIQNNYTNRFEIKPYTVGELRNVYAVSYKTLQKWVEKHQDKIGPRIGNTYTAKQVAAIVDAIGWPKVIEE